MVQRVSKCEHASSLFTHATVKIDTVKVARDALTSCKDAETDQSIVMISLLRFQNMFMPLTSE